MNRLNKEASVMFARLLCLKLSLDLDAGDTSSIQVVGSLLLDLPIEDALEACKTQIGIERVIRYNLDCDPIFGEFCRRCDKHFREINGIEPYHE